jgi:hypothetical protein
MERERIERDPDWRRRERDSGNQEQRDAPYSELSNPADDPDPTEYPDPYDKREDPRDEPDGDGGWRSEPGAVSTSEPDPDVDPEAIGANPPKRENLDE